MISYKALTTASTMIEVIDDLSLYESELFSSNGNILYPYDTETTITATLFKDLRDVTDEITDIRWSIFSSDNKQLEEDKIWNNEHKGKNPITITKDEINGKATIQFEAYKNFSGIPGDDTLIAFNRITITDTNDLLSTGIKPTNPYVGQVWIDTSKEPAEMWMWNGVKWVSVGTVMAMVKNLIRNSAFSTYNYEYFDIVGDTKLSYTPVVNISNGKKWLNLVSETETEEHRGIRQITDNMETIYINSDYSFQFLVYNNSSDSNQIKINIYSHNKDKEKFLIYEDIYEINNNIKHYFASFKTLKDTTNIEVEILGLDENKYNFFITELALYNTSNMYPWEPSPYDSEMVYDSEALFNALTYNGKIQGIYSMVNPNTGQVQYYFNAEYIQSGTLKGQYIDAKNLTVKRDDGVKTLEIDSKGNVNLVVNSLKIGAQKQTIEDFIVEKLDELNPDQLRFLLMQVKKDYEQAEAQYEEYYNHEKMEDIEYEEAWSEYLEQDMIDRVKEEEGLVNIRNIRFNANNTVSVVNESGEISKKFILGTSKLGFAMLGITEDDDASQGEKLKILLKYTNIAYKESCERLINAIEKELETVKVSGYNPINFQKDIVFSAYNQEEPTLDDIYVDYSHKNSLLYKLFVVCEDYITNRKITIVTNEWAEINVDASSIVSEVGKIKDMYCGEGEDKTLINAFGSIANEAITAESIINKVSEGVAKDNDLSEIWAESIIQQTSGNINLSVDDYRNGLNASLELSNDGVILKKDGSVIDMDGNNITLSSNNINLEGYVTFSKLASEPDENDTTIIHGGYLETGTVNGNTIIAKTMSADAISTGTLTNEREGYTGPISSFDLDNGTFKLGDSLIYENGQLSFSGIIGGDYTFEAGLPNWVQKWTTNATEISGEQIVTPRAFIGTYDETGEASLTGISIGVDLDSRHTAGEEGMLDSGIVGYSGGNVTFRLNTDGSAVFGGEDRKLIINTDGSLSVPTIYGDEISAYNLTVKQRDPITHIETNNKTLSIDDEGNVNITPKTFYLSDGIILDNDELSINADYITTGKMSAGRVNITDGSFVVGDVFRIDDENNVYINPTEFHLTNSETNEDAICLKNGITTLNANYITVGELNGKRIKTNSIEAASLMIGNAVNGDNNLTKTAIFYKYNDLENPIENCTLGNMTYAYDENVNDYICYGNKEVFIYMKLRQFYNVTTSKIFFGNKNFNYRYAIEYSSDNETWYPFTNSEEEWQVSDNNSNLHDNYYYELDINNLGVTAKYFKLYLYGIDREDGSLPSPIDGDNIAILGWELYGEGVTTTIDASGIVTGEINANRIATGSITTKHININEDSFSFLKGDEVVFGIENTGTEDDIRTSVTIKPDNFILGTTEGDAIVLNNDILNINASFINAGLLKADRIGAGTLDATNIIFKNLTGDKIDAKGLNITRNEGNEKITTLSINDQGQILVNSTDFIIGESIENGSTVQGMVDSLETKINGYIRMNNGVITIGSNSDPERDKYKTKLTSEKLGFIYETTEVAYVSKDKLYISNTEIKNKLTIGCNDTNHETGYYDFVYRSNGHLTLKWRGV